MRAFARLVAVALALVLASPPSVQSQESIGYTANSPVAITSKFLTQAQVLALKTTAIEIVPADATKLYLPIGFYCAKEAGTAYTLGSATQIQLVWGTTGSTNIAAASLLSGWLNQAGQVTTIYMNPPGNQSLFYKDIVVTGGIQGAQLSVQINVADVTGGTGGVWVTVIYLVFPKLP